MNKRTSRRAVLAGAAALAATPATAIPITTENSETELIRLGFEFLAAAEEAEKLWNEQARLRKPINRLQRKLVYRKKEYCDAWDIASKSPAGLEWKRFYESRVRVPVHRAHVMAENLIRMQPQSLHGLGMVAVASAYLDGSEPSALSNDGYGKLVLDCMRLAGLSISGPLAENLKEAAEWTRKPYVDVED